MSELPASLPFSEFFDQVLQSLDAMPDTQVAQPPLATFIERLGKVPANKSYTRDDAEDMLTRVNSMANAMHGPAHDALVAMAQAIDEAMEKKLAASYVARAIDIPPMPKPVSQASFAPIRNQKPRVKRHVRAAHMRTAMPAVATITQSTVKENYPAMGSIIRQLWHAAEETAGIGAMVPLAHDGMSLDFGYFRDSSFKPAQLLMSKTSFDGVLKPYLAEKTALLEQEQTAAKAAKEKGQRGRVPHDPNYATYTAGINSPNSFGGKEVRIKIEQALAVAEQTGAGLQEDGSYRVEVEGHALQVKLAHIKNPALYIHKESLKEISEFIRDVNKAHKSTQPAQPKKFVDKLPLKPGTTRWAERDRMREEKPTHTDVLKSTWRGSSSR